MNIVRFLALLPRNACVAVLRAYRATISPLYGDVCRYYPSCSTYTLHAVQQQGAVKGVALGAWRILRCNPWSQGGIDDAPRSHSHAIHVRTNGFVVPGVAPITIAPSAGAEASPYESVSSNETQLVGSTRKG